MEEQRRTVWKFVGPFAYIVVIYKINIFMYINILSGTSLKPYWIKLLIIPSKLLCSVLVCLYSETIMII